MKAKYFVWGMVLILSGLILSGCGGDRAEAAESGDVNLAAQAGLADTVRLEIWELNKYPEEGDDAPYVERLTLTDPDLIAQFVGGLDTETEFTPMTLCIPDYKLYFYLEDGGVQELEYLLCGPSLRGQQAFWENQEAAAPQAFHRLLEEQLALNPVDLSYEQSHVNLVERAGLASTLEIEVLRVHTISHRQGDMHVTELSQEHLLTIRDPEVIEPLLASLNADLELMPRVRCPVRYTLRFHLADGSLRDYGYACDLSGPAVLRGGEPFWRDMDVLPPAEFDALIQAQLASASGAGGAGLANPASVYCEEQGYKLEIRTNEQGSYGVCLFPDGSECEEWAFFRGECGPAE